MKEKVRALVEAHTGPGVEIFELQRLPGGYSQETYAFRARHDGKEYSLILRRRPESGGILQSDLASEYRIIQALHAAGLPVPAAYWLDADGQYLGTPCFVMERLKGDSRPDPLFEPGNEALLSRVSTDIIDTLGRIHSLDPRDLADTGLSVPDSWEDYIMSQLDRMEAEFADTILEGRPDYAEIFRFMRRHVPPPMDFRLVHCDYQLANFLFDSEGLKGVIDWEVAHFGDPREDLGWLQLMCALFPWDIRPHVEDGYLERYREKSGLDVQAEDIRFFLGLRGLAITLPILKNMKGFCDGANRDMTAVYLPRPMLIGVRAIWNELGITAAAAGGGA
jgi:aminoglycoside phosphotransferase (APT) family kinase protein